MAALQFPLCLLAQGETVEQRVYDIMVYSVVNDAMKIPTDAIEHIIRETNYPNFLCEDKPQHQAIIEVQIRKGLPIEDCCSLLIEFERIDSYVQNFEKSFGKDAWSQIGVDIARKTLHGSFSYELLALISAINAILGKKKIFKRITLERIQAAINGYKSFGVFRKIKGKGLLPDSNLTHIPSWTIRRRIMKLKQLNFFRIYTYKQRHTFYSTRIKTVEALIEAVHRYKSSGMSRNYGNDVAGGKGN